jgi:uncharacterized repeat protein (TIGR03943 family)
VVVAVTRDVGAVILVLVGGAILRISTGDVYLRYVKEGLRPWLLISGTILVLLGILAIVDLWRSGRRSALSSASAAAGHDREHAEGEGDDGHGHSHSHSHSHDAPRAAWLLVLPVLAIFLVAPPALGAYTAEREDSTIAAPQEGSQFDPLPAGDPLPLTLTEYAARAVWDDGISLEGRTVQLTGFVSAAPEGRWYLTRLGLSCCAADAFATKVLVIDPPYDPPADVWVQITGQWVPGGGTQDANAIPWIQVQDMAEVPPPANPYE